MSKTESGKKTTRMQVEMPERSYARLVTLKAKTEAASYSEVMKNALRVYEAMIAQQEAGRTFILKDKDGTMIEYQIFA